MHYYRRCPICRAYLDPGERCTCQDEEMQKKAEHKKEAAPDAANIQSGKGESEVTSPTFTSMITESKP